MRFCQPVNLPGNIGELAWTVHSGPTRSSNTGPDAAIQGSSYMYTEASGTLAEKKTCKMERGVFFNDLDRCLFFFGLFKCICLCGGLIFLGQ